MKKNVLFLVVDSFLYDKIGCTKYGPSPTPFLDSIKDKCIFATQLYSQGPFTESGNKALLTGSDSLNNGGYMHNLNESDDIYLDVLKKNGYTTSEFFLPYYLYSNKHFKNIDYQYFTSDFLVISVWNNRLKFYSELQKTRGLIEEEYADIYTQLDLTFEAWENFLDNSEPYKYNYIRKLIKDYSFDKNRKALLNEKEKYFNSRKEYVDVFLAKGLEHELFTKIETLNYSDFLDDVFLDKNYFQDRSSLISKIYKYQLKYGLKNSHIDFGKLIGSSLSCLKTRKIDGYLKSFLFLLFSGKLASLYKKHNFLKMLPSCRVMLRGAVEQLIEHEDANPIEIHLHPEELHNRTSFFTYDLSDEELINHEMDLCEKYLNSINDGYKGEIIYDLSLLYIDDCIKEAFDSLEKAGKLSNTLFVITSDHGYSYNCTPLRTEFVNNHHTENYHIPLIIYDGAEPVGKIVDSYHTSKDVLPTIYELCGISAPDTINGQSILSKDNQLDYAISEYMGGGCPDMRERPIQFMIRNRKFLVCYNVKMMDDFDKGELIEVYDLNSDPLELNNLSKKKDILIQIRPLMDILKRRKQEIAVSYINKGN